MDSEYPGAIWMPAHRSKFRRVGRAGFSQIVLHCTDGHPAALGTAEMFASPEKPISSAHFVIGQDGEIIQCVSIWDVAEHAHGANGASVGIEHCCRTPKEWGPDDPGLPPSELQLAAGARLVAWLCTIGGLGAMRTLILGHAEADPTTTHTRCPTGAGIDLDAYVARVAGLIAAPFA